MNFRKMFLRRMPLIAICALCFSTTSFAQIDDRYILTAGSATGAQGDSVSIPITLDAVPGTAGPPEPVSGWSYGVCHDPALVSIVDVVDGVTTMTANNGNPPAFSAVNTMPVPGDGFAVGVVIDLFNVFTLPPGTGYELNVATYQLGTTAGDADLDFCDTLATPPVETLIVTGLGGSAIPVQNSGTLTISAGVFHLSCADQMVQAGSSISVPVLLENSSLVQGVSFGFLYDGSIMTLDAISQGSVVAATNNGGGAEFLSLNITPSVPMGASAGGTVGIVVSLQPPFDFIPVGTANEIAILDFTTLTNGSSDICFSDQVGSPTVDLVVTVAGATQDPTHDCCTITVTGGGGPEFIRGDANSDGVVDISDGLFIAFWFFQMGPAGTCEDAADANGNGALDTMDDPLTVLNFLFVAGSPAPASPFPTCGLAPPLSSLGCTSYPPCP